MLKRKLSVITLFIAIAMIAAACGSGSDDTTTTTGGDTGATTTTAAPGATTTTAAPAEPFRVALIYPGTADDLSWSNAWFEGAQEAVAQNPNVEVESVELINDPDQALAQGSAFASEGFDLILTDSNTGIFYLESQP